MDDSIKGFYTKNADQNYIDQYERDHGSRLDWLVKEFNLQNVTNSRVVDIGGGLGFLGKRLDASNDYWVIDGAEIPAEKRLCKFSAFGGIDIDYTKFGDTYKYLYPKDKFDMAFCLETLEHLTNPYNCLVEIKKIVKENGDIYISIPHENVWHNAIYPALLWPISNFEQFLGQMALPVIEYKFWGKGWNAYHFRCRNASWEEKVMLYHKSEEKFKKATPVEMVNL